MTWPLFAAFCLGVLSAAAITHAWRGPVQSAPGVIPAEPWPEESLFDRHIRHAADALLHREMNTEAAREDALDSAERFLAAARHELKRPAQ